MYTILLHHTNYLLVAVVSNPSYVHQLVGPNDKAQALDGILNTFCVWTFTHMMVLCYSDIEPGD